MCEPGGGGEDRRCVAYRKYQVEYNITDMAKQSTPLQTPKVIRYGVMVGLTLVVFWPVAGVLAASGHAGWLLALTALYSLVLMYSVARAQHESDKLKDQQQTLQALQDPDVANAVQGLISKKRR
jgi:hypothetical protein